MKSTILFKAMTITAVLLLGSVAYGQSTEEATQPSVPGTNKVRIVRLSQVKGSVQIDRNIDRGFEKAIANLPVVEHSQIRTGVGIAEIEFEDNSSLRLAPDSQVEFLELGREASGATDSTVRVVRGTAYVSLMKPENKKAPANQFELVFGARKVNLEPASHVRLDVQDAQAKLAVFDGDVQVNGENGVDNIPKKKTATFAIFDKTEPTVAKDIAENEFDGWDKDATSYHSKVASLRGVSSPYSYGLSDLSYYGSFSNCGGMGMMWRPYFTSASWDPFANGTWAWYPGAGYSWVSPYPWAWTPYHSGAWSFCPGSGWGWMPGSDWYGLNNVAGFVPTTSGGGGAVVARTPVHAPHAPGRPPMPHAPAMVAVGTKPVVSSGAASSSAFVFVKDSAGMGVPRGTLGNLGKFSHETATRGVAAMPVYSNSPQMNRAPQATHANGTSNTGQSLATTIHRGSPPPSSGSGSYGGSWNGGNSNAGNASSSSVSSAPVRSAPVASAPVSVPSAGAATRR